MKQFKTFILNTFYLIILIYLPGGHRSQHRFSISICWSPQPAAYSVVHILDRHITARERLRGNIMTSALLIPSGFYLVCLLTSVSDVSVVSSLRDMYSGSGSERPLLTIEDSWCFKSSVNWMTKVTSLFCFSFFLTHIYIGYPLWFDSIVKFYFIYCI